LETKEWVLQRQLLETAVSLIRTFGKGSDANQKVHPNAASTSGVTGETATGLYFINPNGWKTISKFLDASFERMKKFKRVEQYPS